MHWEVARDLLVRAAVIFGQLNMRKYVIGDLRICGNCARVAAKTCKTQRLTCSTAIFLMKEYDFTVLADGDFQCVHLDTSST